MRLSVPIYQLKRRARLLAHEAAVPLHEALDRIARQEGYAAWSLLAAHHAATPLAGKLFGRLEKGDMVLVAARPGQGKTLMALQLAIEAMKAGGRGVFFTLEYTQKDILERFAAIGEEPVRFASAFEFDCSDAISAEYIKERLAEAPAGTLVVVDYLQLLDQRRENPPLAEQVAALKSFARTRELVMIFISQIDRSYDPEKKPFPDARDVRLPNPLDLTMFSKMCFLNEGEARFGVLS